MNQEGRPRGQKHGKVGTALWWGMGGEGSRRRERGWGRLRRYKRESMAPKSLAMLGLTVLGRKGAW